MRRIILKCAYVHCKKEFFPKLGWEDKQKYCSDLHRKQAWKHENRSKVNKEQAKRWRKNNPIIQIKKSCVVCGKKFYPDQMHQYQKYCSQLCRNKISQTIERRKIWRKTWRQKNLEEIKKRDAIYKAKRRFGVTSNTLNMEIVLKRDKGICRRCGKPYQVIHHVKYSGRYWDLVSLCRACHAWIHSRVKKEPYWIGEYDFEVEP